MRVSCNECECAHVPRGAPRARAQRRGIVGWLRGCLSDGVARALVWIGNASVRVLLICWIGTWGVPCVERRRLAVLPTVGSCSSRQLVVWVGSPVHVGVRTRVPLEK
eukprot:5570037-Prymnesium_polylepis.1